MTAVVVTAVVDVEGLVVVVVVAAFCFSVLTLLYGERVLFCLRKTFFLVMLIEPVCWCFEWNNNNYNQPNNNNI